MPLVSVIIPNYNHASYLSKRIESVLNQTFQDFEIIILDDKSPDHSLEIIGRFAHQPKISKIIKNEVNSGSTYRQWNKGVSEAKGEWIWIAESDDYCEPEFLESMLLLSQNHPDAGVVFCNSHFIDQDEKIIFNPYADPKIPLDPQFLKDFYSEGPKFCGDYILSPIIGNASSAIFKKEIFKKINGADVRYKLCGDWKMWHEMLLHSDLAYSAKKMNYFRHHTNNVRSTKGAQYFLYEMTDVVFYLINKLTLTKVQVDHIREKIFRQWVFWMGKRRREMPKKIQIKLFLLILRHDFKFLWRIMKWPIEKLTQRQLKIE